VVDDAVPKRERAHARRFPRSRRRVRSIDSKRGFVGEFAARIHRVEIVLDGPRPLLLRSERDLKVVVEVAFERRRPREAPPHPPLVRLQHRERRPRHRAEHDVVIREVDREAVEAVGDRRARRTPRGVLGPEHEVVDEQLRASPEEVRQRGAALVTFEYILLVEPDPGQCLPLAGELVAVPRQRLLSVKELEPGGEPLFTCSDLVLGHVSLLRSCSFGAAIADRSHR
jgi:hypothetical protein